MAFPFTIEKKFIFEKNKYPGLNKKILRAVLINVFADDKFVKEENNKISFNSNNSIIMFNYDFDIVIDDNSVLTLKIIFHIGALMQTTILLLVMFALLLGFGFKNYLVFSGIFILIFYLTNIVFLQARALRAVSKALSFAGYSTDIELTNEQKEWLQNPDKCPACGNYISENDIVCKSCGLKIKQNPYTKSYVPSKESLKTNTQIKYHYKDKKE